MAKAGHIYDYCHRLKPVAKGNRIWARDPSPQLSQATWQRMLVAPDCCDGPRKFLQPVDFLHQFPTGGHSNKPKQREFARATNGLSPAEFVTARIHAGYTPPKA